MDGGRIVERGSYAELMATPDGRLARLVAEFVAKPADEDAALVAKALPDEKGAATDEKAVDGGDEVHALMQDEERSRGSVKLSTWSGYLAPGRLLVPLLVLGFAGQISSLVLTSVVLVWWQSKPGGTFGKSDSFYLALYASPLSLSPSFSDPTRLGSASSTACSCSCKRRPTRSSATAPRVSCITRRSSACCTPRCPSSRLSPPAASSRD